MGGDPAKIYQNLSYRWTTKAKRKQNQLFELYADIATQGVAVSRAQSAAGYADASAETLSLAAEAAKKAHTCAEAGAKEVKTRKDLEDRTAEIYRMDNTDPEVSKVVTAITNRLHPMKSRKTTTTTSPSPTAG